MKIIVCIKQVPQVSELRFDYAKKTLIREGVRSEINPFDRRAITIASELKRKFRGEVTAMTMGPPLAKDALFEAMAMGCDRSLHLLDRAFAGSDTLATSRALAAAIKLEMPVDLVFCGKYSVDAETGHVGPEIAELLGMPHVSGATKLLINGPKVTAERETDYGVQTIEARLPFLATTAERLIRPYNPKPEEIEEAKSKPYRVLLASDLHTPYKFGLEGSPTYVSEIYSIETKRKCELIDGRTIEEKTQRLVNILLGLGLFYGWNNTQRTTDIPPQSRLIESKSAFWVVTELVQGRIRPVTYELLGAGLEIASNLKGELAAIVLGSTDPDQLNTLVAHGADRIYRLTSPSLSEYSSDAYASALADTIEKFPPYGVVAASTSFGRDFMPRVAARLGLGMTSDCIGLKINERQELVQLKPAFGGNIVAPIVSRTQPNIATIRPGMLTASKPNTMRKGEVTVVEFPDLKPLSKAVKEELRSDQDALRLDNAEVIVAAGAGIGSADKLVTIKRLAGVLDAPVATTRKVVDLGWLPSQLQVGLTGKSVGPQLYLAVAIRGAFNHMVGIGRAKTVVAINNDPNAPIFKNCDYGIVGDYAEAVPCLTKQLHEAKQRVRATSRQRA